MNINLQPSHRVKASNGPLLLVVLDGIGLGIEDNWNAVHLARTPTLNWLMANSPWRTLKAHGTAVGLPSDADMGNSEVGHNALGAGRVVDQGAKLVNRALSDGSIFQSEAWNRLGKQCQSGGALHFIGLLSDGNVHSHQDQLHALIKEASKQGLPRVFIHILLDGRDVPDSSALDYVDPLEGLLRELNTGDRTYKIASGGGRMLTTMDRYEADWSIVERGWNTHVHGSGRGFTCAREAIETYRSEEPGTTDQFLPPFVVIEEGRPVGKIQSGDAVIFFNFRGDRAIEMCRAFEEGEEFRHFDRGEIPRVFFAGMTLYDGDLQIPTSYLVPPPFIDRTVSEYLVGAGVTQFAMSETQKFGHVTYFWNGNRSGMFDNKLERYEEIESDRVPFEQRPWMKAAEITDRTIEVLGGGSFRFIRINYANGDMVGHTGLLDPTIVAVESVDLSLARLVAAIKAVEGTLLVVADHGNADDMVQRDKSGTPKLNEDSSPARRTAHSLNPVPFIIYNPKEPLALSRGLPEAGLANVAATVAELLGFQPPDGYEPTLLE